MSYKSIISVYKAWLRVKKRDNIITYNTHYVHGLRGIASQHDGAGWSDAVSDGLGSVRGWLNGSQNFVSDVDYNPYGVPDDKCNSETFIKSSLYIYLEGLTGNLEISTHELEFKCTPNRGINFIKRKNGLGFNITPISAHIRFDSHHAVGDYVYYPHIPGNNRYVTQFREDREYSPETGEYYIRYPYQPYSEIAITGSNTGSGYYIEDAQASQGDSGAGLFNSAGELIGVFRQQIPVPDIRNWQFALGFEPEPDLKQNEFRPITSDYR